MKSLKTDKAKKWTKVSHLLKLIGTYFYILPDKANEMDIINEISSGVRFRGANLWILIFAILIASLGLNINSTAVIIGAMLISPIMGPIIGIGLALGIKDYLLLRRSVKNYVLATVISVVTATIYFLISPFEGSHSELLARTTPSLYDVLIALFGGMAGIIAICTKGKSNVIPGVAIATALMPPLCTAGYGLSTANWSYFLGAFYLFFINTVFIGLATFSGIKLFKFKQKTSYPGKMRIGKFLVLGILISLLPATVMTFRIIQNNFFENNVIQFINKELNKPGTSILSHKTNRNKKSLEVVAVGHLLNDEVINTAKSHMNKYGMHDYSLQIIQRKQNKNYQLDPEQLEEWLKSHTTSDSIILIIKSASD